MVVIARKQSTPLVQGNAAGDLYLRVVGSSRDGEIARLSADKCTIGSAPGCTMRLRARGVRPVHCVLLRGARGTVIRAWAPDTRLNGRPVEDNYLQSGDRLAIGPIEFEVLPSAPVEVTEKAQPVEQPANKSAALRHQINVARHRSRKLITTLRDLREQLNDLKGQLHTAGQKEDSSLLDREEELLRRHETLRQQRHEWEASCQRVQDELDARARTFSSQFEELEIAKSEADEHNRRWQQERDQTRAAWESERELHVRELESLRHARDAFEQERKTWSSNVAEAQGQIERERAELTALRQQIDQRLAEREEQLSAANEQLAVGRQQLDRDRQAAEEQHNRAQQEQERLDSERSSLAELQQRLRYDQDHLAAELETIADLEQRCRHTREALDRDLGALDQQQRKYEQERQQWQEEVQNQSLSHGRDHESLRIARQQFDEERSTWSTSVERASAELTQQRQAFSAQREQIETDFSARGQRLAVEQERLERDRQALAGREQSLQQVGEELARERAAVAEQQQRLGEQASAQVSAGDQENQNRVLESLRQLQTRFEQEQQAWSATVAETRSEIDRERSQIVEQGQALADQRDELDRRRSQAMQHIEAQLVRLEQEQRDWHDWQSSENARLAEEWTTIEDHLAQLREGQEALESLHHAAERDRERANVELASAREAIEQERAELRKLLTKER